MLGGRKRGEVLPFRHHATAITSPTQARNAISYILNNWRHHRAEARAPWRIDPFSSPTSVSGWRRPHRCAPQREPLPVVSPPCWLLIDGWKRAGPIRFDEVPGPDPSP